MLPGAGVGPHDTLGSFLGFGACLIADGLSWGREINAMIAKAPQKGRVLEIAEPAERNGLCSAFLARGEVYPCTGSRRTRVYALVDLGGRRGRLLSRLRSLNGCDRQCEETC